jgi:hypothetical protein
MTTDNPQLSLDPIRTICGRHGEPFKPLWPAGYGVFSLKLVDFLLNHYEPFIDEARRWAEERGVPVLPTAVETLLRQKPMCCRVPPDDLITIYREVQKEAGVWEHARCALCRHSDYGCQYRRAPLDPRQTQSLAPWPHVCLPCVVYGQNTPGRAEYNRRIRG